MSKVHEKNTYPWCFRCWWKRKHRYYYDLREDLDITVYANESKSDEESGSFPVFDTTSMTSPAITPSNTSTSNQYIVSPDSSIETVLETPPIKPRPKPTKQKRILPKRGKKKKSKPLTKEFLESYVRSNMSDGSLESIDSLAESYWEPNDIDDATSSQVTPIRANTGGRTNKTIRTISLDEKFLHYHVHFMRAQTKPREVEVVWAPPSERNPKRPPR